MRHCDTILDAAFIITQNENREILHNASIAIKNGLIEDLGSIDGIHGQWQGDEYINLPDMLVMPGLVNAHTHAAMTFLRGFADDLPLMEWLRNAVFPIEKRLTAHIARLGSLLGYAEMLATGTTACVDMYIFEEAVLEAAEQAGLRCMGGEAVFGFHSAACANYKEALRNTAALAEKYKGHPRISIAVNPHSVYTADPEILSACRHLALALDLPIHIHLAETQAETAQCLKEYGKRPVAHIQYLGLMDPRLVAAHLVDINIEEAELLAKAKASGVHNPSSNMKLASGVAPLPAMLAAGMAVGLGTDGPASNNQLNMFAEMRQAALSQKVYHNDPECLPAIAALDMATRSGAAIMGNPLIGSLEKGKAADCIALDLRLPNMLPMHNPVSQAVYAATGHECRMAMVEGEILYKDGKYARFDYNGLLGEVEELRQFALAKL